MTTPTLARPEAIAAVPRWRTVISVFKLRIGVLIMLTALGGMLIAPGPAQSASRICSSPSSCTRRGLISGPRLSRYGCLAPF